MIDTSNLIQVINDTEYLLNDILLSGFHSVQISTMERLKLLEDIYDKYGMETGRKLVKELYNQLNKRKNSFEYDINEIAEIYCKLEFYIKNAGSRIN